MFLLVECPDQELLQHLARTGRAWRARPMLTISAVTETPGRELRYFWISDKIPVLNWRTSSSSSSLNKAEKKCFLEKEYLKLLILSKVLLVWVSSSTSMFHECGKILRTFQFHFFTLEARHEKIKVCFAPYQLGRSE